MYVCKRGSYLSGQVNKIFPSNTYYKSTIIHFVTFIPHKRVTAYERKS